MAITGESLFTSYRNIVNADGSGTYYEVVNGGSSQGKAVTFCNIVNGDTSLNTITLAFQRYVTGSYQTIFEKAYIVSNGSNSVCVDFMIPLLAGTNPDRIMAKVASTVSSGKAITILASGADFT